jgi:hypothetical protein
MFAAVVLLGPETPRPTGINVANQTSALNTPIATERPGDFAKLKLTFLVAMPTFGLYDILARMTGRDRKEVVFQATAVDNNKHHYAIQKAPDGLFCVSKGNYPSASANERRGLDEFTLTVDELRTKFASGEWTLREGSIP